MGSAGLSSDTALAGLGVCVVLDGSECEPGSGGGGRVVGEGVLAGGGLVVVDPPAAGRDLA